MSDELIDILDENGNMAGVIKPKKEAHRKGLLHKVVHVWIYNSKGEVLIQKRSLVKPSYPGLWDISVAGHVSTGEKPEDAAVREMHEELGIKIRKNDLHFIEIKKLSQIDPKLNWYNKEFAYIYLWRFDGNTSKFRLQEEEVDSVRFIPLERFLAEVTNPEIRKTYVPAGNYFSDVFGIIKKEFK